MTTYVAVALVTALLGYISSLRTLRLLWWIAPAAVLVLFSANRYGIGTDFFLYQNYFERVGTSSLGDTLSLIPQEPGFVLLTWATRRLTSDPHLYFLVLAILTVFPVLIAIRKASPLPVFSLFLYVALGFYPRSLNTARQSLAASVLLLAEAYRYERKWLWATLTVVAPFIHVSALIAVVGLFALKGARVGTLAFPIALATALIAGATLISFPALRDLIAGLGPRYEAYLGLTEGGEIGTALRLAAVSSLVFLCLFLVRTRTDRVRNDRYTTFFSASALLLAIGLVNAQAVRVEEYFGIFGIIALPCAVEQVKNRNLLVAAISAVALAYLAMYVSAYGGVVPYVAR
ncbi:EpsG family protein [Microbacterium ulmi]|uniref:EpsG family protein n=1 Tax=Microbacterium ulmi TaxID=179095 RepID=A0A7Y2Q260_9MICO|nr:EpsG family protein [Microbacterium ulmi]NII70157.1 hypothetical protein [Microbacterium ulmi]NNH04303.1 EpsG family protein [Microbacterium ulmi]